ncbi:MAG TPA: maleylpyruvate isomerase N-terminal domain-containing protein [Anaerolineae bacterium]
MTSDELCRAVDEFRRFISSLPETVLVEKAWGPKEALAHLVFWLESYVTQVEALLAGETPGLPRGRFDDLNAEVVAASRGVSLAELLRRHHVACERLYQVAESHDPESIVLVLKQGSAFQHPLSTYMTAEASHIRWHQQILERQIGGGYLDEVEKLRETVAVFCRFIRELPEVDLAVQTWGPKEVLAHLVFWHERYVAQIEALRAGEPFAGPEGRLKDLNALAVEASRGVAVAELLRRFEAADERLREFGRTLDPQNVILEVQSHRHTLDGAISSIETHIRNHHQKLVRKRR